MDEEEDCDKLDSDCEKTTPDEPDLQRVMAVSGTLHKRDCSSDLHLSLTNSFHSFPCTIKSAPTLPPLPSDFLEPVVSKAASSTGSTAGAVSLSHFDASEKPRIWSLARTAASGVILSAQQPGSELRNGNSAGDCQLQSSRISVAPAIQCGAMRILHESISVNNAESPFSEGSSLHSKVCGTGSYSHKGLQLNCSSYAALQETCQYSSIEGASVLLFRRGDIFFTKYKIMQTSRKIATKNRAKSSSEYRCISPYFCFCFLNSGNTRSISEWRIVFFADFPSRQLFWNVLLLVCRILWWQSRDPAIWPQWSLRDCAGWQGHCIQASHEEVKQVRGCTDLEGAQEWQTQKAAWVKEKKKSKHLHTLIQFSTFT